MLRQSRAESPLIAPVKPLQPMWERVRRVRKRRAGRNRFRESWPSARCKRSQRLRSQKAIRQRPLAQPTAVREAQKARASEEQVVPDGKYAANGRRDPFISPVVSHAGGSGCNTGKKCLEIGTINLRGVVRAESGFIAVVSNGLNKAYFLRENDPVFNGYVVKITGDSVVFQETLQDRLGKSFTREVVKKITTPAV